VREDGVYVEAGENDNLIVQKLVASPNMLGVFGFSFLDEYPVSRPLYMYIKNDHVGKIPGIEEFVAEFVAASTWGEEGYLAEKGMIPMPAEERKSFADAATSLTPLSL